MTDVLQAAGLGKRYGRVWALQDCSLAIPSGRIVALVGPNGAGKTTLLQLTVGLVRPTAGEILVFGQRPFDHAREVLPRVGFVAQDHPLYRGLTVRETLELGRRLNPRWDPVEPGARMEELRIPLDRPVGKLSGGQQAQVALALALGKRPDLLLLDEPLASLDPLARRDFLRTLMDGVAEAGTTVVLSSHIIGDLERVCDHLVILATSHVQVAGGIADILAAHRLLVGPRAGIADVSAITTVIEASEVGRQASVLVRMDGPILDPAWESRPVSLEDVVLAYLGQSRAAVAAADARMQHAR